MTSQLFDKNVEETIYALLLAETQKVNMDQMRSYDILRCNFFQIGVNWREDDITELKEELQPLENLNIYLCNDGDIILMWPPGTKSYNSQKLIKIISAIYKHKIANVMDIDLFFEFYNMNEDSKKIRRVIAKKLGKTTKAERQLHETMNDFNLVKTFYNTMKIISMQRTYRSKPHILLVEDQIFSQKLVTAALEDYTVHIAANGPEAILAYMEKCPDIVILDIELPDLDGHALAKIFNNIDDDCYIVILTANNYIEHIRQAKENNIKRFLKKPVEKAELLEAIENFKKHKRGKKT